MNSQHCHVHWTRRFPPSVGRSAGTKAITQPARFARPGHPRFCPLSSAYEVRICTNRTCKRQGSQQILKFAQDLGIDNVTAVECGCLGNCGHGPNMVLLPQEVVLRHIATPADFADVMRWQCSLVITQADIKATQLRLSGNELARGGDLHAAVSKYQQALEAEPEHGRHMLHSNLSAAHLQLGQATLALEHAQAAVQLAPKGFANAWVRLIDSYYALGQLEDAKKALDDAVQHCTGFTAVPEYKVIVRALQKAGKRSTYA